MLQQTLDMNETCLGNQSNAAKIYLRRMREGIVKTTCREPCTTVEYSSVFQGYLEGFFPGISIQVDRDVIYWEKRRSVTISTVWEDLGSAMGLWLGFGVLQLGEKMEEFIIEIRSKLDAWKLKKDGVLAADSQNSSQ